MISIIAGTGKLFGSGHRVRMQTLRGLLGARGVDSELYLCETNEEISARIAALDGQGLLVLDVRDFPASRLSRCIALDNRAADRNEQSAVLYYDTIPHPDAFDVFENILIDPALAAGQGRAGSGMLVYAGSQNLPVFLETYAAQPGALIVREGEMSRADFLDALSGAATVVSYFGMTVFESMVLGRRTILYSIGSAVHDRLSEMLADKCAVPFVRSKSELDAALAGPVPARCRPGLNGFEKLADLVAKAGK